ncbi:histidine kinase [Paraflavitalea sp. CAU 1676]|uniref:sensor histidine kinase n=1 Tax=Paraflavitalea sp. CAU 1676 TaxID=3032598 RepID=UPI0023DAA135|nr:histidine kinase [Paraflavitalea sp. CAU 1676]MDF2191102.1 histidine kinase [Paraflavitalea sp. CAU 1676]
MNKFPFIFSNEPRDRLSRHLAFWTFWWLFQGFLYAFTPSIDSNVNYMARLPISIVESAVYLTAHMFLAYSLIYFVIPVYLLKNKYFLTGFWVLVMFFATAALSTFLSMYVIDDVRNALMPQHMHAPKRFRPSSFYMGLLAGLRGAITIGGMAAAIKLTKHWYIKEQRNLQLQKENAEAQLQLLKAQVHPHFLFNTLNNIYSHTQNVAPVASQLVMGLSDMLRFMLYECNQPLVPLSKELAMIRDYISLEKIRYDEQFDIHIDLPAETGHLHIAPLLLLPLVENCFKHGASNMLEQPWLNLQISLKENIMDMRLMNGQPIERKQQSGFGIGIHNVRKRLELLYPGKHTLKIFNEEEVFVVTLSLQLENIHTPRQKEESLLKSNSHA